VQHGTFDLRHFDPAEVRFMDPKLRLKESIEKPEALFTSTIPDGCDGQSHALGIINRTRQR